MDRAELKEFNEAAKLLLSTLRHFRRKNNAWRVVRKPSPSGFPIEYVFQTDEDQIPEFLKHYSKVLNWYIQAKPRIVNTDGLPSYTWLVKGGGTSEPYVLLTLTSTETGLEVQLTWHRH